MQKSRIEKSDGRRAMAEEGEQASSPDRGHEILLPWKTQVYFISISTIKIKHRFDFSNPVALLS